jgi:hypothetical protein
VCIVSQAPGLFAELKRRNVFRVGAAYLVVGWLLIEVADTVFPRLGLPDWTVTLVIAMLLLGLAGGACSSPGPSN